MSINHTFCIARQVILRVMSAILSILLCLPSAIASIDVYEFDSPAQEAQYRALIDELRCPKCQNQNLAGSDAPIAQDLKQKTYDMVMAGQTDTQIRDYMKARYGDFISYKPPVRPSTWILWFFPPLLLLVSLLVWLIITKKRQSLQASVHQQLTTEQQAQLDVLLADKANPSTSHQEAK